MRIEKNDRSILSFQEHIGLIIFSSVSSPPSSIWHRIFPRLERFNETDYNNNNNNNVNIKDKKKHELKSKSPHRRHLKQ